MAVIRKHEDFLVLCDLAVIEVPNNSYMITTVIDAHVFKDFTDMELGLLYLNMTGEDISDDKFGRNALLQLCYDTCIRLPSDNINKFEAERQAEYVEGKDKEFQYIKGSSKPNLKLNVDSLFCKTVKRDPNEEQAVLAGNWPALKARVKLVVQAAQVKTADSPNNTAIKPKRGTAKDTVWKVADELWEKEGKPASKNEVLAIRKRVMDSLEREWGIKRTSSSSELGNWHKTRAPF